MTSPVSFLKTPPTPEGPGFPLEAPSKLNLMGFATGGDQVSGLLAGEGLVLIERGGRVVIFQLARMIFSV